MAAFLAAGTTATLMFGAGGGAFAQGTTTISYAGGWQTNGIVNPVGMGNVIQNPLAYSALAIYKYTGAYNYWPLLAKSWKITNQGNQVTVYLNPNAKWSNGTPVTANDVYVTFEIQFMFGNPQSWGLTGMKVLNPHTIVFYKNPHFLYNTAVLLQQILNNNVILPAADFQQFIPANLWQVVKQESGNPKLKSVQQAQLQMGKWTATIQGHNFTSGSNLLYDGPWEFQNWSSSQELYTKNPDFLFANHVNADQVMVINQTTNDVTWRALANGTVDFTSVAFSPPVYNAVIGKHGNQFVAAPLSAGVSLLFNENIYPYNMPQVRQALAYMINRQGAWKIGLPVGSKLMTILDGMTATANHQWLTQAQLNSLNPYSYDPAKGAALLESVGFKKTSQGWIMPNGKPFTMNIYAPQFTAWDAAIQGITGQLTSLGIKASPIVVNTSTFYSSQGRSSGKYAVAMRWWGGWNMNPANTYNQIFIGDNNFRVGNQGQLIPNPPPNPLGVPLGFKIPGFGWVQPESLAIKLDGNLPAATEKQYVLKLAKAYNYWLPAIPIWNNVAGHTFSTQNWVWPAFQHNPALLNQFTHTLPFVVYQILGLMKPKQ